MDAEAWTKHPNSHLPQSSPPPPPSAFASAQEFDAFLPNRNGSSIDQPSISSPSHRWSNASLSLLDDSHAPEGLSAGSFASWVNPALGSASAAAGGAHFPPGTASPPRRGGPVSAYTAAHASGAAGRNRGGVAGMAAGMLSTVMSEDAPSHEEEAEQAQRMMGGGGEGGEGEREGEGDWEEADAEGGARYIAAGDGGQIGRGPSRLHNVAHAEGADGDGYGAYGGYGAAAGGYEVEDPEGTAAASAASAGYGGGGSSQYGGGSEDGGGGGGWPSDPEDVLALLQQQRSQYRSWVAQCASTALAALDPEYDTQAGPLGTASKAAGVPEDVPAMVAAMDVAGQARHYLLMLKSAAESTREAGRALSVFEGLALPPAEAFEEPADVAAGEAAEAEYVSAAYGVTTAVAAAAAQVEQLKEHAGSAASLLKELTAGAQASSLEAPLIRRLERVGLELAARLRQEATVLMGRLNWPPPLAEAGVSAAAGDEAAAALAAAAAAAGGGRREEGGPFVGFEAHPVLARRLVGVLTALTHFQMAVEQRPAFYGLLAGGQRRPRGSVGSAFDEGGDEAEGEEGEGEPPKPLLWAAQALAEPVAAKLRAHFHPAAPTGRLDRPCWLLGTAVEWVRRHGHSLASLDDMLACLQLKPHYNMPAEFARALQDSVLALLRDHRLPAMLAASAAAAGSGADGGSSEPSDAAEAEAASAAEGLWTGLLDAAAAYDMALLPLLGATGPRVEAAAAKAVTLLAAASTGAAVRGAPRACDVLDPAAPGATSDMHARFVALAAVAAARGGLAAWAAAEGGAALRAVEAAAYDDSSLAPAEEAASRALGGFDSFDADGHGGGGGGSAGPGPWQRYTWPPVLAAEAAAVLDGLVARSRWLCARPEAQRDFLEAAAGPVLSLLRRRLGRLVDAGVARGDAVSEEGMAKVCSALCAAHHLADHLHSLLLTDLAPLVEALAAEAEAGGGGGAAAGSGAATPTSSAAPGAAPLGKLGAGGGGSFWSGLLAASGGGGGVGSPGRQALRDGVTALAGGAAAATAASLASAAAGAGAPPPVLGEYVRAFARLHRDGCLKLAREVALGFGRCSVAYRHAIEANPQFPFTPDEDDGGGSQHGGGEGAASPITPSFAPALLFLQSTLSRLSRCCDKATFAAVWRGAALSINRFMFNFIATESRFSRAGARQFAADVAGLSHLFAPYTRRGGGGSSASSVAAAAAAGGQHFRELQAAARLLCLADEEAGDVMRRASAAAVAAQAAAQSTPTKQQQQQPRRQGPGSPSPTKHARGDPVRAGMWSDPVLSGAGLAVLSPLQIMNVIEHRI